MRLLRLTLLTFVFPLLGAAFGAPSIVVYPITSTGASDPATGGNIALVIATKLTELGGIAIKPPTPGTTRASYLDAALAIGADYYVLGFLSPLGTDNSLVTQVVSTQTGSVVFSTTTSVRTYGDAIAQADAIRTAILRHAGRGLAAFDAPPTPPASSPSPLARNGSVDITNVLRKRPKSTSPTGDVASRATATPTVTAATTSPPSIAPSMLAPTTTSTTNAIRTHAMLFATSGSLDEPTRRRMTSALARELGHVGVATTTLAIAQEGSVNRARSFCLARPDTTLLLGSHLDIVRQRLPRITLDLIAYDCTSHIVGRVRATEKTSRDERFASVIDRAATAASVSLVRRLFP